MDLKLILLGLSLASLSAAYDWKDYYSLEETEKFLNGLLTFPDNLSRTRYITIGKTYSGRDIKAFEIEFVDDGLTIQYTPHRLKNAIFIEAGIYGNEWIAPAAATYLINRLVKLSGNHLRTLLNVNQFNWYIVPFANPDGYDYSFTTDPLWRKNRRRTIGLCRGVDLNRNFDIHWNNKNGTQKACSNVFPGFGPRSENETRAITRYLYSMPRLKAYISLQGYGTKMLYPFGFSNKEQPKEKFELNRMADVAAEKLTTYYGTKYTSGDMFNALHQVSGTGMDFAVSEGLKMAFTFKLRPMVDSPSAASRRVPRNEILPTVVEAFNGIMLLAKDALNNVEVFGY